MNSRAAPPPGRAHARAVGTPKQLAGWFLLALTLGYVALVHHGLAPAPSAPEWWQPTAFLFDVPAVKAFRERPVLGIGAFSLPAFVLLIGVFATNRSALARALALSACMTVVLFAFYAFVGERVWRFFSWRGTLVLISTGLAIGFALASPWLAESWSRLRSSVKLLVYLPVVLTVIVVMRHITGTNETMAFNVSPWPAFSVLGLDVGVYTIAGMQFGIAAGVIAASLTPHSKRAALGLALACPIIPALWFVARHPSPGMAALMAAAGFAVVAALAIALWEVARSTPALPQRAGWIALGAALVAFPVIAGQSLATGDYVVSRFARAQLITDALADYYAREQGYPDDLEELVDLGALDRIPEPRVGFETLYDLGLLEKIAFHYQNLGSSYILEFEATEWVQCAYNPPWADEEGDFDGSELEVEEAWSCPDARPDLW